MKIYSYTPYIIPGPNGTIYDFQAQENEQITHIGKIGEANYIATDSEPLEQDERINLAPVDLTNNTELAQALREAWQTSHKYRYQDEGGNIYFKTEEVPAYLYSLEESKERLLSELDTEASAFEQNLNKDMFFTSSLGFKVNGDRRTKDNLQDLITFFDLQAIDGVIQYRDYDNVNRELTKEQLQVLLQEHIKTGQGCYLRKWDLQNQISNAETLDDLHQIEVVFYWPDYSDAEASVPAGENDSEPTN